LAGEEIRMYSKGNFSNFRLSTDSPSYIKSKEDLKLISNMNVKIQSGYMGGTGTIFLNEVEYTNSSVSDARKKKNIFDLSEKYELLFDSLLPKRYKYIDGTSDRYHTGFIAQEVVDSILQAGLTTQDFAAVVLQQPGTENELWQLRRDEFVALNTWQIQKLKPRMDSAEIKLIAYEARISVLEKELENLKNS
jgi:hypothetical protein